MKSAKTAGKPGIALSLRLPALVRRPLEGLKGLIAIVTKRCAHGAEKSQAKTLKGRGTLRELTLICVADKGVPSTAGEIRCGSPDPSPRSGEEPGVRGQATPSWRGSQARSRVAVKE